MVRNRRFTHYRSRTRIAQKRTIKRNRGPGVTCVRRVCLLQAEQSQQVSVSEQQQQKCIIRILTRAVFYPIETAY